ncbi:MAG: GNAT family N-acetyltransferase [Bacteroidia bacterium]|nr:GNAT family N-acetyltransferase [Bacteroidia bacterium]
MVSKAYGSLLVVKSEDKILGGILCVGDGNVLYEWFVCGDDGELPKVYPSVMATRAGIEYAVNNGYRMFDFMGAGKPDSKYGVRDFKARFGGKLVEHGRFLYICSPFLYFTGKVILALRRL